MHLLFAWPAFQLSSLGPPKCNQSSINFLGHSLSKWHLYLVVAWCLGKCQVVKAAGMDAKMKFKPLALVFEYGLAPGTHVKRHSAREIELVLPLKPSSSVKAPPSPTQFLRRSAGLFGEREAKSNFSWNEKKKLGGISTWAELQEQQGAGDKTKINLSVTTRPKIITLHGLREAG